MGGRARRAVSECVRSCAGLGLPACRRQGRAWGRAGENNVRLCPPTQSRNSHNVRISWSEQASRQPPGHASAGVRPQSEIAQLSLCLTNPPSLCRYGPPPGSYGQPQQPYYPPPGQQQQHYPPPGQNQYNPPSYQPPSGFSQPHQQGPGAPVMHYPPPNAPPPGSIGPPAFQNQPQHFAPPSGHANQYSNLSGKRKALLIGINYVGTSNALRGCHNDARNVKQFLQRESQPSQSGAGARHRPRAITG